MNNRDFCIGKLLAREVTVFRGGGGGGERGEFKFNSWSTVHKTDYFARIQLKLFWLSPLPVQILLELFLDTIVFIQYELIFKIFAHNIIVWWCFIVWQYT